MRVRHVVVLATAALALLGTSWVALFFTPYTGANISERDIVSGNPSFGEGPIALILFEDFLCVGCRTFSQQVFPRLYAEYVATGRIRCTVVPLAFLKGSRLLANALLGVYVQAPERFFPFVDSLVREEAIEREEILAIGEAVGGIDRAWLAQCIDLSLYDDLLEKNLQWAKNWMGEQLMTPALFIQGTLISPASFEAIAHSIAERERRL
jgi:protein-disulfide isomerase